MTEPEPIDTVMADVIGYRSWGWDGNLRMLTSLYRADRWLPASGPARCTLPHVNVPEWCKCGFWAYHRPDRETNSMLEEGILSGVIRARGVTVMHERGFRCEYADILALHLAWDHHLDKAYWRSALTQHYPDVPKYDSLAEMIKDFPPTQEDEPAPDNFPGLGISNWQRHYLDKIISSIIPLSNGITRIPVPSASLTINSIDMYMQVPSYGIVVHDPYDCTLCKKGYDRTLTVTHTWKLER